MWILNRWLASRLTTLLKGRDLTKCKEWARRINAATSRAIEAVEDDEVTTDEINAVVEAITHD